MPIEITTTIERAVITTVAGAETDYALFAYLVPAGGAANSATTDFIGCK